MPRKPGHTPRDSSTRCAVTRASSRSRCPYMRTPAGPGTVRPGWPPCRGGGASRRSVDRRGATTSPFLRRCFGRYHTAPRSRPRPLPVWTRHARGACPVGMGTRTSIGHRGLRVPTPAARQAGTDPASVPHRARVSHAAQRTPPTRWSGATRNWTTSERGTWKGVNEGARSVSLATRRTAS